MIMTVHNHGWFVKIDFTVVSLVGKLMVVAQNKCNCFLVHMNNMLSPRALEGDSGDCHNVFDAEGRFFTRKHRDSDTSVVFHCLWLLHARLAR